MAENFVVSYAQNREDIILSAFFLDQKKGFYVDVGANDPELDSVTKYFYDLGWHGINIEPNPWMYKKLQNSRERDLNLNVGASDAVAELDFREYEGHGLSTMSSKRKAELGKTNENGAKKYKDYKVKVLPLREILKDAKVRTIDFMKIDVEGYEHEVIMGNDWSKFRPRVLCIESNHLNNEWPQYLEEKGYTKVYNDGLNDYYVDSKNKPPRFDYLNAAVGRRVIPSSAVSHLAELSEMRGDLTQALKQVQKLELENQLMREKIAPLIYENEELRRGLNERRRLRAQAKTLLKSIDSTIMMHIGRLNSREPSALSETVAATAPRLNPMEILSEIKRKDINSFYDLKTGIAVKDKRAYTVAMSTYLFMRRGVRLVLVGTWKGLKMMKKAVKHS